MFASIFGKLSPDAIPTSLVTLGGVVSMLLALAFIAGLITYKKRWTWLYREWLTTTDPKKIGVM
jgi:cytochrome o ubiquinol oxidase subunit 1